MNHRGGLSARERAARNRLCQLIANKDGFLHASLIKMVRTCGKATCKCQTKGAKHESCYIGQTYRRKTRMQAVPRQAEASVHRWVVQYQQARTLLEQLSEECWQKLGKGKSTR